MPAVENPVLAPGARVSVRDEDWIVRSVKTSSGGGVAVYVTGLSELVRGKDAIFLSELDDIVELKPEETELVADDSPQYRRSRLFLESLLRRSPATETALYVGHRAAIDRTDYQLQPAVKALSQPRPRILMADGVGLGKTIEVGILLSELIQRGRADRILVVALKSILSQFQKELWARFTIPLVRLDSIGIERVQSRIPSNMNPFYYFNRVIISIDTLKRDEKYRRYLEQSHWDVTVVDECQHVAIRTTGSLFQQSQRARLAQLLGRTSDALILTSATPHDGRPESFASLINLLEPTAIADEESYTSDEVADLFIRRFKKDIAHEVRQEFPERSLSIVKEDASATEDAVFEKLGTIEFKTIGRQKQGKGVLFRTVLLKAFLSSPAACASTIENRLAHEDLQGDADPARHDRSQLEELKGLVDSVHPAYFKKLQTLLVMLRGLGLDRSVSDERVVIFTERIDTLKFLRRQIEQELGLSDEQVPLFHGTLDDQEQQKLVESFGTEESPVRVLLASDAASEGINLHYYCHRLVHFDLPWSFITLEQRNGRIDRYGQTKTPEITYLLTIPGDEKLKGDLRVLERLIEKEDAAQKNLGDVAWLMNLHDAEKEEERIGRGIEEGQEPETVIPEEAQHTDFMALLFGEGAPAAPAPQVKEPVRLFKDELAYAREALKEAIGEASPLVEWHDHLDGLTLHPPDDLLRRFEYLPKELLDESPELKLTVNRERVMKALEEARQKEGKWPEWQLLWEQHPVAEWLADRALAGFHRHSAPILRVGRGLESGERVFVVQGLVSNNRSQAVIVDWFGVRFRGSSLIGMSTLEDLIEETGLDRGIANPGGEIPELLQVGLANLRAAAVEHAREHMLRLRRDRAAEIAEPLREGLRKVKRWHDLKLEGLDAEKAELESRQGKVRKDQERRLAEERDEVEKRYQERRDWIDLGVRTASMPYLRIAAVLIAVGGA
jgi:superfamily II DNA or RNA helicase